MSTKTNRNIFDEAKLQSVEWSKLFHAYGTSEDIPDRLRLFAELSMRDKLAETDTEDRKKFDELRSAWYADVFHQGTVFAVTSKVVPFLIDIFCAKDCSATARSFIATYLHNLVQPYFYDVFPQRIDLNQLMSMASEADAVLGNNVTLRRGNFEAIPNLDEQTQGLAFVCFARDTYFAIEAGVDSIVRSMEETFEQTADETMMQVISLLTCFPRKQNIIAPLLWNIINKKGFVVGSISLVCLVQLNIIEGVQERASVFRRSSGEPSLYGAVAELLLKLVSNNAQMATEEAERCALQRAWNESKFACPLAGSLRNLASRMILECFRKPVGNDALDFLGEQLATTQGMGQISAVKAICTVVNLADREEGTPFTSQQRKAIELLATHVTWGNVIYTNISTIFRAHGLPYNKQKLLELLKDSV